ncbi:hypothetical protein BpHYR1_040506 [Brachionus plicatilis]|uniref:Uncharacterized protein n=1 Tax=Brachionus plicatilis TaxID=10195 RepID=A0A3M7RN34_BRAPC|nr:hypothetical protein BpHYR1_040506 [Brachionus plicatilis]
MLHSKLVERCILQMLAMISRSKSGKKNLLKQHEPTLFLKQIRYQKKSPFKLLIIIIFKFFQYWSYNLKDKLFDLCISSSDEKLCIKHAVYF